MAFEAGVEALRKKYGPFTGWTWGTIGSAGIAAWFLFFHKKGASNGNTTSMVPTAPPLETTNGPGGPSGDNPGPGITTPVTPTVTTPPPDTFVNPPAATSNPPPGMGIGAPAGNYVVNTPAGSKVTVTPQAFELPAGDLTSYLHVADTQKAITESLSPQMSENQQYAAILRGNVQHGLLTMNDQTAYGNNQHGTVADAITFYEQNGGGTQGPPVGSSNGSASAGATQGG